MKGHEHAAKAQKHSKLARAASDDSREKLIQKSSGTQGPRVAPRPCSLHSCLTTSFCRSPEIPDARSVVDNLTVRLRSLGPCHARTINFISSNFWWCPKSRLLATIAISRVSKVTSVYFCESSLFNGLRARKLEKPLPRPNLRDGLWANVSNSTASRIPAHLRVNGREILQVRI